MLDDENTGLARRSLIAGLAALGFGGMTLAATFISDSPGGSYSASDVTTFLSAGDRTRQLIAFFLAIFAIPALVYVLAHFRDMLTAIPGRDRAASIVWGTGLAASACFAIGWGVQGGQIFARWEGGSAVTVSPPVAYVISEIGVVFVFGCGAMLLGFALITLCAGTRGALPKWVRGLVLLAGLCGVAGLAWAPFFVMLLVTAGIGVWLMLHGRAATSPGLAVGSAA